MNRTTYTSTSLIECLNYPFSMRDAVLYPVCIMIVMSITDIAALGLSWSIIADYIASIAILPFTVMLCDYIPPHIAGNYRLLSNPGIKRIVKIGIFMIVATVCMMCVHYTLPSIFYDQSVMYTVDNVDYVACIIGHAAESVKFIP